ncbi:MAG: glycine cleavage system protein H, partial [Patescibacteria group bacterium]|nr:glycine cleavage system protein H [Patescibacteria group bacterium]
NSPVDGEVVEVNKTIADRLETLSTDPFDAGWLVKIRVTDESALAKTMDSTTYEAQCREHD